MPEAGADPGVERRVVYLAHTLRSDWNNGNAHFLRGLMRSMTAMGHHVTVLEPETEWSLENLRMEELGTRSLEEFGRIYGDLDVRTYRQGSDEELAGLIGGAEVVILHEWNPPELAQRLLGLRAGLGFRLAFHDTHHRASSSPEQMARFGLERFDGVIAFGEALRAIYRERFGIERVWTLHEAADTTVFKPLPPLPRNADVVWIGNWGEGERAAELREFLLEPAKSLGHALFTVYGVRYPPEGLEALRASDIAYGGYVPNLDAPGVYARAGMTLHVPRQQYSQAMTGIPTIRVFEALACGIPLLSAPWQDTEGLFREGDFRMVRSGVEMGEAIDLLMREPQRAEEQAARGLETVLARHTCGHRARDLTAICEELIG